MSLKATILNISGFLCITSLLKDLNILSGDIITGPSGNLIPSYSRDLMKFLVISDYPMALAVKYKIS